VLLLPISPKRPGENNGIEKVGSRPSVEWMEKVKDDEYKKYL
jgi:hypothetical protein